MAFPSSKAFSKAALLSFVVSALAATSAQAALFSLSASGTLTSNSSSDTTLLVGTPFMFDLIYDTDAPDLDFELVGSPDPTFGRFTNTGMPPALVGFHYRAGDYEVTISDPAGFAPFSEVHITFTSVHAIDINVHAPDFFPPLAGGDVIFHADFNSPTAILENDGLPANPDLDFEGFDENTVSLLPPAGAISGSPGTSLTLTALPEPSSSALAIAGFLALLGLERRRARARA
jgi:hypothetical protein